MARLFFLLSIFLISLTFSSLSFADESNEKLLPRYELLMKKYPAKVAPPKKCVKPNFSSDKKSKRYRTRLNSEVQENGLTPNFCGNYIFFNEPITGGGDIYLADCHSGKVTGLQEEYASNHPLIKLDSCLLIEWPPQADDTMESYVPTAYGAPRLYFWNGKKLKKIKDPIWTKK